LKFDFLGIRNLSILADAVERVKKNKGVALNIETIPLDDKKTFTMLARGDTMGLFQLNGSGMTRFLKELKPSTIHDINAMVALYRPGPMDFIPSYIERKHNPHLIHYLDPALKNILAQTYGILVYQDDLLMMAHQLAGYTWGEVDKFRKAVGKKIPEEMMAQKEKFIKGCIEHSKWPEKKAVEIWTWIEPFAAYGFNKAHAASYGRVAYQTAYMKANFPVEYMAAIMTAESGDIEKVAEAVTECARMKIAVLPPDINESFGGFTVVEDGGKEAIRFGLYSIKNFGEGIGEAIITERTDHGRFVSLADFLKRIKNKNLNKKSLEALIKCGALDALGERGQMLHNIEYLLEFSREHASTQAQSSLFGVLGDSELSLVPASQTQRKERLMWEKELLGLFVSGFPLDPWKEKMEARKSSDISLYS
jgi:DNA polymerase-3 subunit alpha